MASKLWEQIEADNSSRPQAQKVDTATAVVVAKGQNFQPDTDLSDSFTAMNINGGQGRVVDKNRPYNGNNHFRGHHKYRNSRRASRRDHYHEQRSRQNQRLPIDYSTKNVKTFRHHTSNNKMSRNWNRSDVKAQQVSTGNFPDRSFLDIRGKQNGNLYDSFGGGIPCITGQHVHLKSTQGSHITMAGPFQKHALLEEPHNSYMPDMSLNYQHPLHETAEEGNMRTMQLEHYENLPLRQQVELNHLVPLSTSQILHFEAPRKFHHDAGNTSTQQGPNTLGQSEGLTSFPQQALSNLEQIEDLPLRMQAQIKQDHELTVDQGAGVNSPFPTYIDPWDANIDQQTNSVEQRENIPPHQQAQTMRHLASSSSQLPYLGFPSSCSSYYESKVIYMSDRQKWEILCANGILKAPEVYKEPIGYYNGPLCILVPEVAQAIMNCVDQNPTHSSYSPWSMLMQSTMLMPYGLPPQLFANKLSQAAIHKSECRRHAELMREVLAVPGRSDHGEAAWIWYRLLGEPRHRHEKVAWHPNVIDLYGEESQYEALLIRDVNHRNNNEKGRGRSKAPSGVDIHGIPTMRNVWESVRDILQATYSNGGLADQTMPTTKSVHQDGGDSSTSVKDLYSPVTPRISPQYIKYRLRVKGSPDSAPDIDPMHHSRCHSTENPGERILRGLNPGSSADCEEKSASYTIKTELDPNGQSSDNRKGKSYPSASKTPLLDFDREYTAKYGAGKGVDFAMRDMGPPKIGGLSFNEAVGFQPTPEKCLGGDAPFGYPKMTRRKPRD